MSEAMTDAIDTLPGQQQTVIYMLYVDGFTQSEIAKQIHVSQPTVHRILHNALRTLREEMAQ